MFIVCSSLFVVNFFSGDHRVVLFLISTSTQHQHLHQHQHYFRFSEDDPNYHDHHQEPQEDRGCPPSMGRFLTTIFNLTPKVLYIFGNFKQIPVQWRWPQPWWSTWGTSGGMRTSSKYGEVPDNTPSITYYIYPTLNPSLSFFSFSSFFFVTIFYIHFNCLLLSHLPR